MIGRTLARYQILERLGTGGMGEVYLAEDGDLGRKVALKLLPPRLAEQCTYLERFRREARAAAALQHPNVVTLYSVEEAEGLPFLTMELVEGKTLADLIPAAGLDLLQVLEIGCQVASALAAAHERGIVHRDIKPRNLMVAADGLVKVLDFGIAKRLASEDEPTQILSSSALTQEGQVIGTLSYMSPEQLRHQPPDPRSDLFSLGVVLYEMATGDLPFQADTPVDQAVAILQGRLTLPGEVRTGLPQRFDEIVSRCLERDPRRRYQRARELRDDLDDLRLRLRSGTLSLSGVLAARQAAGITALAVLPLENLAGAEEYFVHGLTDALISTLGQIRRIRVISRQSVMRYKGSDKSLPAIARELGVDVVLTGSVLRAGQRVRISVQLVCAEPERQIWSEVYNRSLEDVLALQDEVAREVAREVRLELTEQEEARLSDGRRVNPAAYELYLRGRFQWDKRTSTGLRKAVGYFEEALLTDPDYAAAHAGLADAYALLGYFRHEPPDEAFGRARTSASRALSLDPSLAEAHASLGFVQLYHDWEGEAAAAALYRAIELNPSYATAHHWLWGYLAAIGRLREAGQELRIARQLNPFSPTVQAAIAAVARLQRDFPLAIDQCRKAIDLEPGYALSHEYLWILLHRTGRLAEACEEYQRAVSLWGFPQIAERTGALCATSGYRSALLDTAEALAAWELDRGKVPVQLIAESYALAGADEPALSWVERGMERREPFVFWLRDATEYDALRGAPRFEAVVERVLRRLSSRDTLR